MRHRVTDASFLIAGNSFAATSSAERPPHCRVDRRTNLANAAVNHADLHTSRMRRSSEHSVARSRVTGEWPGPHLKLRRGPYRRKYGHACSISAPLTMHRPVPRKERPIVARKNHAPSTDSECAWFVAYRIAFAKKDRTRCAVRERETEVCAPVSVRRNRKTERVYVGSTVTTYIAKRLKIRNRSPLQNWRS